MVFDIDPVAKGRPRLGRFGTYTPAKTRTFETALAILANRKWKRPVLSGGLNMVITFHIPVLDKRLWGKNHIKRPDIDNLVKGVCDALNGLVWNDDGQITNLTARKRYAEKGSIELEVTEL